MKKHKTKWTYWNLKSKMLNYYERNHKYSPLNFLEYNFLKLLYFYLTKQVMSVETKDTLYDNYIRIINLGYWCNRSDLNREMIDVIYKQCNIILEQQYSGPLTFIMLNNHQHYKKMKQVIELMHNWSINPQFYGYASKNEFFKDIDFLRKQFTENKIDIYSAVDKWPKEFKKRFNRN